ncbi:MAG: N-acetyltransferase [Lachnospiraceae bacterium]|nr:N-acetyltransferase [Lachnospiraceae bacterium]
MHIRLETPKDYYEVENLTREVFWTHFWESENQICEEHYLVNCLRECSSYVPELNFLAEIDGKIVGHIIYTHAEIVDESQKVCQVLTFGPLSVHPDFRNVGIGKALMQHSFAKARALGYRAVIIFGHPDYYPRVGFRRAVEFGIVTADGQSFDPFMVYPLYEGALAGIRGRFYIDPVYEDLEQEVILEYDKQFPHKDRYIPVSIEVLLERLDSEAKASIESLGFDTLYWMKTKSVGELMRMEGIDWAVIDTIQKVMREYGAQWGVRDIPSI